MATKQRSADKLSRIPIKIEPTAHPLPKPPWLRKRLVISPNIEALKASLQAAKLVTVCEEASCPNLPECFSQRTATFMIMGDKCTRRCAFCDVGHGRPDPLDPEEPLRLAKLIAQIKLQYVVLTSVDRDDLRDGGASHFAACIKMIRRLNPAIKIETLVPDYRGRLEQALQATLESPPDCFNHNIETIERLYKQARPGANYQHSLNLLQQFKRALPDIPTKSGLMLGLGETQEEVLQTLKDLHAHQVDGLTIGQYLQPSPFHLPVVRYVPPEEFTDLGTIAKTLGFTQVASGPFVRSSYHADKQAAGETVN